MNKGNRPFLLMSNSPMNLVEGEISTENVCFQEQVTVGLFYWEAWRIKEEKRVAIREYTTTTCVLNTVFLLVANQTLSVYALGFLRTFQIS